MYICNIIWPKSDEEITKLLLSYMVKVVKPLDIAFPSEIKNPLEIAQLFLSGELSVKDYRSALELCWKYIGERDAIRNFEDKNILLARLGICLLSTNNNLQEAGDKLAWFFEVLDYLKVDTDVIVDWIRE